MNRLGPYGRCFLGARLASGEQARLMVIEAPRRVIRRYAAEQQQKAFVWPSSTAGPGLPASSPCTRPVSRPNGLAPTARAPSEQRWKGYWAPQRRSGWRPAASWTLSARGTAASPSASGSSSPTAQRRRSLPRRKQWWLGAMPASGASASQRLPYDESPQMSPRGVAEVPENRWRRPTRLTTA